MMLWPNIIAMVNILNVALFIICKVPYLYRDHQFKSCSQASALTSSSSAFRLCSLRIHFVVTFTEAWAQIMTRIVISNIWRSNSRGSHESHELNEMMFCIARRTVCVHARERMTRRLPWWCRTAQASPWSRDLETIVREAGGGDFIHEGAVEDIFDDYCSLLKKRSDFGLATS